MREANVAFVIHDLCGREADLLPTYPRGDQCMNIVLAFDMFDLRGRAIDDAAATDSAAAAEPDAVAGRQSKIEGIAGGCPGHDDDVFFLEADRRGADVFEPRC